MNHIGMLKIGLTVLSVLTNHASGRPAETAVEIIRQLAGRVPEKHGKADHCEVCHAANLKSLRH